MPNSANSGHAAAVDTAKKQVDAILCGLPSYESRFTVLEHIRVRWLAGFAEGAHDTEDEERPFVAPATPPPSTRPQGTGHLSVSAAAVGVPRLENEDPSIKSAIEQLRTQGLILDIPRRTPMMSQAQLDQLKGNSTIPTPFTHALMKHGFDIRLGEQGRSGLKQEISKCCRGSVELRDACTSIARLKTASIPQLIQLAEVCGILPKALRIAQKYWRTKRRRGPSNGSNSPGGSNDRDAESVDRMSLTFTDEATTPRGAPRASVGALSTGSSACIDFTTKESSPVSAQSGVHLTVAGTPSSVSIASATSGSAGAYAMPSMVILQPGIPQHHTRPCMARAELALAQAVAANDAENEPESPTAGAAAGAMNHGHRRPLNSTPTLGPSPKAPRLAMTG